MSGIEWERDSIGNLQVANIVMGQSPHSSTYNKAGIGLPFFQGKVDFGLRHPKPSTWCSSPLRIAQPGDILISVRAPVGDVNIATEKCCIGRGITALRSGPKAYNEFLFYLLLHHKPDLDALGSGAIFKAINRQTLESFEIGLPPLPEQRAIAAVLAKIQKAVEVQEKIVGKLKELKAATMAKLFRAGLRGEPLKQTEIGEIPESWEVVRLGDVCSYTTGKLNSEKAVEHGEYPFFTCSQETFRINSFSFDQEALLLAGNNAQGKYSVKHYRGKFDAYQRTYVISIKDNSALNYRFLLHELARKLELLRRNSLGATTKYLTASVISNLEIAKPRLEEQEQFSNILLAIDDRIGNDEKRHAILKSLFASMLNLLMTGQVRVRNLLETTDAPVDKGG